MVVERLHEARNVWLATVRPDGRPHVAPVWFVYVEDRIWIGTGLTSVRVRNLRNNPAASACLEQGDEPLVAEGTVVIHESARPATVVDAFRGKYDWDITIEIDNDV
ncbi:MAG: pyridoxamine 5'-phosphate oxidase family protein, partial [Ilumatobacteraceae bacterium]